MKTLKAKTIAVALTFFCIVAGLYTAEASHLFGGEITWKCEGSGQYVFTLKIYRDCNGIPIGPFGEISVYGHPIVCSIPFDTSLTQINDLSTSSCSPTCATGGPGTIQEFVHISYPVSLPGVPPSTGWVFSINDCCRNPLQNLPGSGGFTIRSIMYPYNNTNADPCFDSSPFFAEKPNTYICIGYPYSYNPAAIDSERDSLVYSWGECLDGVVSAPCTPFVAPSIGWQSPYSLNNQLPGNPTINSKTGEINFYVSGTSGVLGNFASCVKVTAYRCGVKVAEIYRDCGFILNNDCFFQGFPPNNNNIPPSVAPPFIDPNTGLQTSFSDTVVAGDFVSFNFGATDFQQNLPGSLQTGAQTVTLSAIGDYFGTGFIDATSGCAHPPCATLNPAPPVTNALFSSMQFNWQTSCNLINNIQVCTNNIYNTFYFILTARDNGCPANAITVSTISITVTGPEIFHSSDSIWISYPGATSYQWYADGVLIPGATDSLYVITVPGLFYSCQMATSAGCTLSSRLYFPPTGIGEVAFIRSVTIAPNPAREKFVLNIGSNQAKTTSILFTDLAGRTLLTENVQLKTGNNTFEYSTYTFGKGLYFVKVGEGNSAVTKKLIVQ